MWNKIVDYKYKLDSPKLFCSADLGHCWRMVHWYQHVSAGPTGAGTNVLEPYKAGTLVPARNSSRH